jgi:transposase
MPTYQPYYPDQAELLPAHVKDVLGPDHLCFVVHEVVEACDLSAFEKQEEDVGGQRPYDPRMMLKIWLYGFSVNVRTTRKLEQRIREDLGFRYLAGGATPDHKTLSEFHRRHRDAITSMFTEVLMFLRHAGMARLGAVAIDSTRVKGSASPDRLLRRDHLERELRKKVKQWQQELDDDPDRDPGTRVGREQIAKLREQLKHLRESGEARLSTTDPDARFLRERGRFVLGYTAEIAVSEDHFIVAQRVTQSKNDNDSLVPLMDEVERQCRERPQRVLAKSAGDGRPRHRSLRARPESGPRVEHRQGRARSGTDEGERSSSVAFAPEVAYSPWPRLVQEAQGAGRAGAWDVERAARHAAVSTPRKGAHRGRMGASVNRLQFGPLPHAPSKSIGPTRVASLLERP